MKHWFIALSFLSCISCSAAAEEKQVNGAFQVHGRLSLYNGNPGFRIWIVGTKRILGVTEISSEKPVMPAKLAELARGENLVFGDFTVVPLGEDKPGVMRMVRVVRAEHLVISDGSLRVIQRIEAPITEEANQSAQSATER